MNREGWGARSAPIADIAEIARNRKSKTSPLIPLINTDDIDRKQVRYKPLFGSGLCDQ